MRGDENWLIPAIGREDSRGLRRGGKRFNGPRPRLMTMPGRDALGRLAVFDVELHRSSSSDWHVPGWAPGSSCVYPFGTLSFPFQPSFLLTFGFPQSSQTSRRIIPVGSHSLITLLPSLRASPAGPPFPADRICSAPLIPESSLHSATSPPSQLCHKDTPD